LGIVFAAAGWAACSAPPPAGPSPTPTPTPTPTATPPVVNTPPIINSITTSLTRAEVDQLVDVIATVTDAETPVAGLQFAWTANVGGFNGTGAHVQWVLPKGSAPTPVDVVISLTVTETFTGGTNVVNFSAAPIRAHDSFAEISKISVKFLVDLFGNSNVSPDDCLVDFWDQCPGRDNEEDDIAHNRAHFVILSASAHVQDINFTADKNAADVYAPCAFRDREISTGIESTSPAGAVCVLTALYQQSRWWLCDSAFKVPDHAGVMSMRDFFTRRGKKK
jgi:hypothetical protein